MSKKKEYNIINIRVFLDKEFKNNLKVLLRAFFNVECVCYLCGKLELAEEYAISDVVELEIAELIYNEYKDWKDLYNALNEHVECIKHFK